MFERAALASAITSKTQKENDPLAESPVLVSPLTCRNDPRGGYREAEVSSVRQLANSNCSYLSYLPASRQRAGCPRPLLRRERGREGTLA